MSKSMKALAILGVVAGLGVASLPLSTYAKVTYWDGTGTNNATNVYNGSQTNEVAGDIIVKTTIEDVLSMSIAAADDADTDSNPDTPDVHQILFGTDGVITNGKAESKDATVVVTTNNILGYKLNLKGTSTGLKGTKNDKDNKLNEIPAVGTANFINAADLATAVTAGTAEKSGFGYKIADTLTFTDNKGTIKTNYDSAYQAVTIGGEDIVTSGTATTTDGDGYTITFGVAVSPSQAADEYSNTITLTASATQA